MWRRFDKSATASTNCSRLIKWFSAYADCIRLIFWLTAFAYYNPFSIRYCIHYLHSESCHSLLPS